MNDENLRQMLKQADERFWPVRSPEAASSTNGAALIDVVRRRRQQRVRRRTTFAIVAVLFVAGGLSAWGLNGALTKGSDQLAGETTGGSSVERAGDAQGKTTNPPAARQLLNDDDIARLKEEIAELEAEANRARQFVELYRAAEARRERVTAADAAPAEPLLPPDVVAQLEIDRAAAITVISADVQANEFSRLEEAAESYQSVLKHFPDSRWASVARDRLAQVQHMN